MANTSYLLDAMTRIAAMEQEALVLRWPAIDAVRYTFHIQSRPPFWTNTLQGYVPEFSSEVHSVRVYRVKARYHVGFRTEGVPGELEDQLYTEIPIIENFFMEHPMLTCAAYPTPCDHLAPVGISIALSQGLTVFTPLTGETEYVGTEFDILLPFNITIAQQD